MNMMMRWDIYVPPVISGNMWTTNNYQNYASVRKIEPNGTPTIYTSGIWVVPSALAFDGTNMWVCDWANTVSKISPTGSTTSYGWIPSYPADIAFDGVNMWTANADNNSVSRISPTGDVLTYYWTGNYPSAIAFDGTNMWTANTNNNSVSKITPAGVIYSFAGQTFIWVWAGPRDIAFDGVYMWTTNTTEKSISRISSNWVVDTYSVASIWYPYYIAYNGTEMWVSYIWNDNVSYSILKISQTWSITDIPWIWPKFWRLAFDGTDMWSVTWYDSDVVRIPPNFNVVVYNDVGWYAVQNIAFDWALLSHWWGGS